MVFQSYALYPHLSVRKNLSFGLENLRMDRAEIAARVAEAARMLELDPYLDRKPKALSGGQRQRVAIGRAIVRHPRVFLFDEPLSNLDAKLRVQTRGEISRLHRALGTTMVYVTHDQVEAMTMAQKIVVLNAGRVEQVGAPLELFERPANTFVAGFIGSPRMNLYPGRVVSAGRGQADGGERRHRPPRAALPRQGAAPGHRGAARHPPVARAPRPRRRGPPAQGGAGGEHGARDLRLRPHPRQQATETILHVQGHLAAQPGRDARPSSSMRRFAHAFLASNGQAVERIAA